MRLHAPGLATRRFLEESRAELAEGLSAQPDEIVFTSGGTESVALGIWGAVRARRDRGNRVVVLTDAAEPAEEIDSRRAQEARERAQQALAAGALSAADEQRARAALQRALVRLRVTEGRRRRR